MGSALLETGGAEAPSAAFDSSGNRLVIAQMAPDCAVVPDMTITWLSVPAPDCAEIRVRLSLWDLRERRQIATTSVVTGSEPRPAARALTAAKRISMLLEKGLIVSPAPPMALDLPEPSVATFSLSKMGFQSPAIEIVEALSRVALAPDPGIADACRRLPPAMANLGPAEWAKILPNETFRPICPNESASAAKL